MSGEAKPKYEWYQTQSHVVLSILIKNVKDTNVKLDLTPNTASVEIKRPEEGTDWHLNFNLMHAINVENSSHRLLSTKVEVKLKKVEAIQWTSLEGVPDKDIKQFSAVSGASPARGLPYPSSHVKKHDWDKIAADVKKEEESEQLEGDAALNQLFQKIYSDGSDDQKKAMNKSFQESGGTVLSTNWDDIKKERQEVKPPDGMEFKKY